MSRPPSHPEGADGAVPPRPPVRTVFIRGVTPRSGTNYLRDVLLLHPSIERARIPVWEDFVLDDAALLTKYVSRLSSRWPRGWGIDEPAIRSELTAALGSAVSSVLIGGGDSVVVAKTPSTQGIELFRQLFPDQGLVLLVRDGRSVVESLVRSFDWDFEAAAHEWRVSADRVLAHASARRDQDDRLLLLRYEDVLNDPVGAVDQVAAMVGLPMGSVTTEAAGALPIRGSSDFGRTEGGVHWTPVAKDESFRPERRWEGWDARKHARFNWIAGPAMVELGYELVGEVPGGTSAPSHRARDAALAAGRGAQSLRRRTVRIARSRGLLNEAPHRR